MGLGDQGVEPTCTRAGEGAGSLPKVRPCSRPLPSAADPAPSEHQFWLLRLLGAAHHAAFPTHVCYMQDIPLFLTIANTRCISSAFLQLTPFCA